MFSREFFFYFRTLLNNKYECRAKQNNLVKMQVHKNKDEAWQRPKFFFESIWVVTQNIFLVILPIIDTKFGNSSQLKICPFFINWI